MNFGGAWFPMSNKESDYYKEYNRETYSFYKARHICTRCKKNRAAPGHVACDECREAQQRRYAERCNGRTADEQAAYKALVKQQHADWYKRLREQGICVGCGKRQAASGRSRCVWCLAKDKRRAEEKRRQQGRTPASERGMYGECAICLKKPAKKGYKLCESCYNKLKKNRCTSQDGYFRDTMNLYFARRNNNAVEKRVLPKDNQ